MRRWRSSHPNHVLCLLGKMPGAGVGDSNHFPTCRLDRLERCFDADWHCTSSQHRETAGSSRQAGRMTEPWAQVAWCRGPELHHERASGDGTNDWFVTWKCIFRALGVCFISLLKTRSPLPWRAAGPRSFITALGAPSYQLLAQTPETAARARAAGCGTPGGPGGRSRKGGRSALGRAR